MSWDASSIIANPKRDNSVLFEATSRNGTKVTVKGRKNKWYSIVVNRTSEGLLIIANDVEIEISNPSSANYLPGIISEFKVTKGVAKRINREWFKPPNKKTRVSKKKE